MFYRLSNRATKIDLENEFEATFKYPNIYEPMEVINGLKESLLPIITQEDRGQISPAIWGILPHGCNEDWEVFSRISNSLHLHATNFDSEHWCLEALLKRRCLILITGIFTTMQHNGKLYPHYVRLASERPFCLAGIYNQLQDGFITCSFLVTKSSKGLKKIHNLGSDFPLILSGNSKNMWLNKKSDKTTIFSMLGYSDTSNLFAQSLPREFYTCNTHAASFNRSMRHVHTLTPMPRDQPEVPYI